MAYSIQKYSRLLTCAQTLGALLIAAAALLAGPYSASAQFIETKPGVYQNRNMKQRVIVSYSHKAPGVFILTGPAIDIQLFNPEVVETKDSDHVFIGYDARVDRYTTLHVGGSTYAINGDFTLQMGPVRIAVDNRNPYLSIVVEENSSILGFRGQREVVNSNGDAAITLLEAGLFQEYDDVIWPYTLRKGKVYLRDKIITDQGIGVTIKPPKNVCVQKGKAAFLYKEEVNSLRGLPSAARSGKLKLLMTAAEKRDPFDNALLLSVRPESLVTLNYIEGTVQSIRVLNTERLNKTVCLVENIEF